MAARTLVGITSVSRAALTAMPAPSTGADPTNGNFTPNDGATWLAVLNTDTSAHTLTVTLSRGVDQQTAGPRTYPVPISSAVQLVGPFPLRDYGPQLLWNLDSALVKVAPYSTLGP